MKQKSVLFITPQPFFARRGSPLRVKATVASIAQLGHEVDLLAYPLGSDISIPGVSIERGYRAPGIAEVPIGPSWKKVYIDLFFAAKAAKLIFTKHYDIIHGIEEGGVIAALLTRIRPTPFIYDMHSHMSDQLRTSGFLKHPSCVRTFESLEAWCMKRASAVVTVGDDITTKVKRIAPNTPAFTLNDCPLELPENCETAERMRQELGLSGKVLLVYTGNLESYQGIDLLLAAFSEFCKSNSVRQDVALVIVGGDKGGRLENYKAQAGALGIADKVVFTGERSPEEVVHLTVMADFLVSSRIEGTNTPLKVYSYMAACRPIIATRILSHTQVLGDASAYLGEPNPAGLASAISQAVSDSGESAAAKVAAAKELAESRYSRRCFLNTISQIYGAVNERIAARAVSAAHAGDGL